MTVAHEQPVGPVLDVGLGRFELLVSSVVGRSVRIEPGVEGEKPHANSQAIFVAPGEDPQHVLAAIVVQAALLAAGSLDAEVMRKLIGRPNVTRRYLAVEGWRALAALADGLPGLPIVADSRGVEQLAGSPAESLAVASGRRQVPALPEVFGVIRPRRVLAVGTVDEKAVPALLDGVRLRVDDESPGEDEGEDEGEESEPIGKLVKLFSSPLVNPLMAALMKRLGGGGQSSSGTGSGDIVRTKRSKSPLGARTRVSMSPDGLVPTQVVDSRGWGWRYPEWDVQARRYRMDWCTVIEAVPHPEDARAFAPPRNPDLRRRLVRLGVGLEHRRRQPSGDDIDVDAAVDSRVDFLAGCTPDDGVYVENQRRRRSLSVLVLLDVSGSLAEAGSAHGSAHEQQRQAAAMLTDTLHGLGDRVALYGFRSHGRSSVYLLRVKGFGDPMDGATYERLGGLSPSGYTRLGAGIRHSAHLLATQGGTDRRLLVLLSDGFPYEDGYQGPYAEADARRALAETRRRGIGCLCLTLGASTPRDSLGRVFGAAAHASAPRLEDLTSQIGPLFRSAMASAGTQRRIAQRHRPSPRRPRGNR